MCDCNLLIIYEKKKLLRSNLSEMYWCLSVQHFGCDHSMTIHFNVQIFRWFYRNTTSTLFLHSRLYRYPLPIQPDTCPHTHTLTPVPTHTLRGWGLTAAWYCWMWCCGWASPLGADSTQYEAVPLSVPVSPLSLQLHDLTFASDGSSVAGWRCTQTHAHQCIPADECSRIEYYCFIPLFLRITNY